MLLKNRAHFFLWKRMIRTNEILGVSSLGKIKGNWATWVFEVAQIVEFPTNRVRPRHLKQRSAARSTNKSSSRIKPATSQLLKVRTESANATLHDKRYFIAPSSSFLLHWLSKNRHVEWRLEFSSSRPLKYVININIHLHCSLLYWYHTVASSIAKFFSYQEKVEPNITIFADFNNHMKIFLVYSLIFLLFVVFATSQSADWLNIHVIAHTHDVRKIL